jgi:hypothetical protein
MELLQLLDREIAALEQQQRLPHTSAYVARRLGNIILHMKQLRADLGPAKK